MMRGSLTVAWCAVAVCAVAGRTVAQEEKPSCAVLRFDGGGVLDEAALTRLVSRYDAEVNQRRLFAFMSSSVAQQRLRASGFKPEAHKTASAAAIAAGDLLDVDYVIFGRVRRVGYRWSLETSLVDIYDARYVNRILSYLDGSLEDFLLRTPASNLNDLLAHGLTPAEKAPRTSPAETVPSLSPLPAKAPTPLKVAAPVAAPVTAPAVVPVAPPPVTRSASIRQSMPRFNMGSPTVWEALSGHLEVGTRFIARTNLDDSKNTFVGSVDKLDMDEDALPTDLFVAWFFNPRFGVELEWDTLNLVTITSEDGHTDGDVTLSGPVISAIGRFPLHDPAYPFLDRIVPYLGVGISVMKGEFEPEGWWYNGFTDPDWQTAYDRYLEWVAQGQPAWPNGGYRREMAVDSAMALILTAGCTIDLGLVEGLTLDTYLRYMKVDTDVHVTLSHLNVPDAPARSAQLPLSNITFGLGLRYAF